MTHYEYTTIKHPRSGEIYAVEMDVLTGESEADVIEAVPARVAGPVAPGALDCEDCGHGDHDVDALVGSHGGIVRACPVTRAERIEAYISAHDDADCRDDAIWLRREIERAR